MSRRFPILLALLACLIGTTTYAAAPRWNILFCFADDWGRYASCYAKIDGKPSLNDAIKTPSVDRLAREGVLFRSAFVNAPSCTPCRSSLVSGRYFFNCGRGAILNGAVWDSAIPTFPLLLKDSGYTIGKSYKVWSPGTPADAPIGGQEFAYESAGRLPNNFSEEAMRLIDGGSTVEAAKQTILSQVRDNFESFLKSRKQGQPWLFWWGTTTTHRVWIKGSGKKLWNIEPESLAGKLPKFLPDVPEVRQDVADYLGECQAVDAELGILMECLERAGELDRTLVVASGDHGMPGVPGGKCNLYDHGTAVTLAMRVPGGKGGRVIDDLVRLPDLAPTFMEVGGVAPPANLYGKSLLPLLQSDKSGLIDSDRNWVITGRERHVARAREGNLPYPMRALRTPDFLYIRNFAPDRWPMGSPAGAAAATLPTTEAMESSTYVAYADMDASPTKAWLIEHRDEPKWKWHHDYAFAKRPSEELYDLKSDPEQTKNVAADPAYAKQKQELSARLMKLLADANDPRLSDNGRLFENPPFTDAGEDPLTKKGKKKKGE